MEHRSRPLDPVRGTASSAIARDQAQEQRRPASSATARNQAQEQRRPLDTSSSPVQLSTGVVPESPDVAAPRPRLKMSRPRPPASVPFVEERRYCLSPMGREVGPLERYRGNPNKSDRRA